MLSRAVFLLSALILFSMPTFAESNSNFSYSYGMAQSENFGREKTYQSGVTGDIWTEDGAWPYVSYFSSDYKLTEREIISEYPFSQLSITRIQFGFKDRFALTDVRYGVGICSYGLWGDPSNSVHTSYICYQMAAEKFLKLSQYFQAGLQFDLTVSPQTRVGDLQVKPFVLGLYAVIKVPLPKWNF